MKILKEDKSSNDYAHIMNKICNVKFAYSTSGLRNFYDPDNNGDLGINQLHNAVFYDIYSLDEIVKVSGLTKDESSILYTLVEMITDGWWTPDGIHMYPSEEIYNQMLEDGLLEE